MYHSGIYSLNKDVLHLILEFHGKKAYATFGLVNKEFHKLFDDEDYDESYDETTSPSIATATKKETFIGFISPQILMEKKEENLLLFGTSSAMRMRTSLFRRAISLGIIKYRNIGLLDWAIKQQGQQQQQQVAFFTYGSLLRTICHDAAQSKDGLCIF